jgi:hypothetical protein
VAFDDPIRRAGSAVTPTPDATLLLPEGTRLVHIGPPKTGTTSLQRAFHAGRQVVASQGVHYTGPTHQPVSPVLAVTGRSNPIAGKPPALWTWRLLVREVKRAREPRVLVSSEFFADAGPDAIRKIVADLDPARVHVAVTLRPLAKILPSQWQQFVQAGLRESYDQWLHTMFDAPAGAPTPTFWLRHRHDQLIARWAEVVGPQNVTVVALDDRDQPMVLRVFERLLGLRDGTLAVEPDLTNRSMTLPEVEVVRAFNASFRAEGLATPLHTKVMRYGAAAYMKTRVPEPDEQRIETPGWAIDRAAAVAREMVDNIGASGVRVIGDLEGLTLVPAIRPEADRPPEVEITPRIAASAAMGVLLASGMARGGTTGLSSASDGLEDVAPDPDGYVPRPSVEPLALVRLSTLQVAGVLLRRTQSAVGARLHRIRRRIR